jgi:mRNA-degrading endonuclease toxin of MazEF toxin-antitoxin module
LVGSVERGEIRRVRFGSPDKERPVLIISRPASLRYMQRALVVPLTRSIRGTRAEVRLGTDDGLPVECVANLFETQSIRISDLGRLVAALKPERWPEVREALLFAAGFDENIG